MNISPVGRSSRTSLTTDEDVFRHLALAYSKNHTFMHEGTSKCNDKYYEDGITNGAYWYTVQGKLHKIQCNNDLVLTYHHAKKSRVIINFQISFNNIFSQAWFHVD